jgi:hypothetical protein
MVVRWVQRQRWPGTSASMARSGARSLIKTDEHAAPTHGKLDAIMCGIACGGHPAACYHLYLTLRLRALQELTMPALSPTMEQGNIASWQVLERT